MVGKEDYTILKVEVTNEKNTVITIADSMTWESYTGKVCCNSKDKFDYKIGIKLALDCAIDEMKTAREIRDIVAREVGCFFGGLFSNRY